MKKLSVLLESRAFELDVQDNTIGEVSALQLEDYLKKSRKFISNQAADIVQYFIDHSYAEIITQNVSKGKNLLKEFVENNAAKNEDQQRLIDNVKFLAKKDRLLEVPMFMTKEQFDGILSGKINPDDILLDLTSERGRNAVANMFLKPNGRYAGAFHKIINSYMGASKLSREDLVNAAMVGITWAINGYGKKSNKQLKREANGAMPEDIEKYKGQTFCQFASFMIRFSILEAIKDEGHTVRVARSQQQKERKEKGYNTRNTDISGDTTVSSHNAKDEDGAKTMFDFLGDFGDDADKNLNDSDSNKLWKELYDMIEKKFDARSANVFYDVMGLNGREEPIKATEVAKKYGIVPSNITYIKNQIIKWIKTNDKAFALLQEIYDHFNECQHDYDMNDNDPLCVAVTESSMSHNSNMYEGLEDNIWDLETMVYKVLKWFGLDESNKQDISDVLLNAIFSATDETQARLTINSILTNEDRLSQRYAKVIKNFVNFMYDNVDESQELEYADRIVKLSELYKIAVASKIEESANENAAELLTNIIQNKDQKYQSAVILLRYYFNHLDMIEKDRYELNSTEIKKAVTELYKATINGTATTSIDMTKELIHFVADNDIEFL